MKSIMPIPRDNQEVLVHTLVGIRETRYEPDFRNPSCEVIPLALEVLTVIYPVNMVMGEVHTHLFVKGAYTT